MNWIVVENMSARHHGHSALITNSDCEVSQYEYSRAANPPNHVHVANQRGTFTRANPITAIVTNTDSAAMPKNEFGKLSPPNFTISACQDCATAEQESTAFTSQPSCSFGCLASCSVSALNTNETISAAAEASSTIRYVQVAPCRHPCGLRSRTSSARASSVIMSPVVVSSLIRHRPLPSMPYRLYRSYQQSNVSRTGRIVSHTSRRTVPSAS